MATPEGGTTWSDEINKLDERLLQARWRINPFSYIREGDLIGATIELRSENRYQIGGDVQLLDVTIGLTPEEIKSAPKEIRMVFGDLGLYDSDDIKIKIIIDGINRDYNPRHFQLIIRPKVLSEDKVGVLLSTDNESTRDNNVIALTKEAQRAREVYHIYASTMAPTYNIHHPFLVDILYAGAKYVSSLLSNRYSPQAIEKIEAILGYKLLQPTLQPTPGVG